MKTVALLVAMLTIVLAILACVPSGQAGLRPDPATWPAGFAEAAGPHLSTHIQIVLRDPHMWAHYPDDYEALQALKGQHPEWKDHIDYLLKLRWMH